MGLALVTKMIFNISTVALGLEVEVRLFHIMTPILLYDRLSGATTFASRVFNE